MSYLGAEDLILTVPNPAAIGPLADTIVIDNITATDITVDNLAILGPIAFGGIVLETNTNIAGNTATVRAATGLGNANLALIPEGTGAIVADIPDNLVSGGNARGAYAVDLQTTRSQVTQVASGNQSGLFAGAGNTSSGIASGVFAGGTNVASGQSAVVLGGQSNTASGFLSAVVCGNSNNAGGSYTAAIGGLANTATGTGTVTIGGENNNALVAINSGIFGGFNNIITGGQNTGIIGGQANATTNALGAVIVGSSGSICNADNSVIISGSNNTINVGSNQSLVIGATNTLTTSSNSYVCGSVNNFTNSNLSFAIGNNNTVTDSNNLIAIGNNNTITNSNNSIAIGSGASITTTASGSHYFVSSSITPPALTTSNTLSLWYDDIELNTQNFYKKDTYHWEKVTSSQATGNVTHLHYALPINPNEYMSIEWMAIGAPDASLPDGSVCSFTAHVTIAKSANASPAVISSVFTSNIVQIGFNFGFPPIAEVGTNIEFYISQAGTPGTTTVRWRSLFKMIRTTPL